MKDAVLTRREKKGSLEAFYKQLGNTSRQGVYGMEEKGCPGPSEKETQGAECHRARTGTSPFPTRGCSAARAGGGTLAASTHNRPGAGAFHAPGHRAVRVGAVPVAEQGLHCLNVLTNALKTTCSFLTRLNYVPQKCEKTLTPRNLRRVVDYFYDSKDLKNQPYVVTGFPFSCGLRVTWRERQTAQQQEPLTH